MKTFYSLPKAGEGEAFYSRYASLIPTLNKLGYLAQVVSALTEFGIIYSLVYGSLVDFWPDQAPGAALAGAVVGTAFLEIGLRKFVPYSARAVIHKRYSGLDGWMTSFVLAATVGLLGSSGWLSFSGSKEMVSAVAPPVEQLNTAAADSTAAADRSAALATWRADSTEIAGRYAPQLTALTKATDSEVRRHRAAIATLRRRERAEDRRYTTRRAELAEAIEAAKAEGARQAAALEGKRADELAAARQRLTSSSSAIAATLTAARDQVTTKNEELTTDHAQQVRRYGGGLAYFTVLCLAVFVVSVILTEIHRKGAEMVEQVEPGAFDFEPGVLAAFSTAFSERVGRRLYGIIHSIERATREAPEPVAPPTVWSRNREGIPHQITGEGVPRRAADHRRKWIPFSVNRAKASSAPPATPTPSTASPSATPTGADPSGKSIAAERIEAAIISYLHAGITLSGENFHEQAETLFVTARDVIRTYLGPKATPDAVTELENAVIDYLNDVGPNPFEHHHSRRQIGFNSNGKTCAIDERRKDANGPVTNGPVITGTTARGKMDPRACDHCGQTYTPKAHNQRFCSNKGEANCKDAYHAAQHGGQPFNPNRYHANRKS